MVIILAVCVAKFLVACHILLNSYFWFWQPNSRLNHLLRAMKLQRTTEILQKLQELQNSSKREPPTLRTPSIAAAFSSPPVPKDPLHMPGQSTCFNRFTSSRKILIYSSWTKRDNVNMDEFFFCPSRKWGKKNVGLQHGLRRLQCPKTHHSILCQLRCFPRQTLAENQPKRDAKTKCH